jgi:hypothetical protein
VLNFEPVTGSLDGARLRIEHLTWDDVLVYHDAPNDPTNLPNAWFDEWFDPDERRYVPEAELGNMIHSLGVQFHVLSVDLGTAAPRAFLDLLHALCEAGATELRITSSRAEAEASKPA